MTQIVLRLGIDEAPVLMALMVDETNVGVQIHRGYIRVIKSEVKAITRILEEPSSQRANGLVLCLQV